MKVWARDVRDPEGPVCLPDGSWVITEMEAGCLTHLSAGGAQRRVIAITGRPNGLALDAAGSLWVAESRYPALLRVTLAGEVSRVTAGPPELPFLWPNDLCFGPDGGLYLTDSGALLAEMEGSDPPEAAYERPLDGRVFRIDPATGACQVLDRGLRFANGIAFGPGGAHLYVAETHTGNIYRYRSEAGGAVGARELFANVMTRPPREFGEVAGPDGMAFDEAGNLHVAVLRQGDITVLAPSGRVQERIALPGDFPTNIAFAGPGRKQALVTEGTLGQLLLIDTPAAGLALYA